MEPRPPSTLTRRIPADGPSFLDRLHDVLGLDRPILAATVHAPGGAVVTVTVEFLLTQDEADRVIEAVREARGDVASPVDG